MLYSTATLDRATGEMVSASLGEWLTISEVGRTYDTGPRRTRQILVHMGFLAPEGRRYRLPLEAVAKGWGKRLKNPSTGRPFDVVSPEGQRLIALGWADAATDLEAEESGEPEVAEATAALEAFAARRAIGLDTEGRVRWLLDYFPDLDSGQVAEAVCVSRQLVERYAGRRKEQVAALETLKAKPLLAA